MNIIPISVVKFSPIEDPNDWLQELNADTYYILENGDTLLTKRSGNKYLILYEETSDCTCPYSTSSNYSGPNSCYYCKRRIARKLFLTK
jgi:hypothetical protein